MATVKQLFQEDKSVFYKSVSFFMKDENKLISMNWVDTFLTDKIESEMLGNKTYRERSLLKKKLKNGLDNWNVHGFLLLYVSLYQEGKRYDLMKEALESIPLSKP